MKGLQGGTGSDQFLIGENVIATAKHFVGDGGTQLGIDKGDTIGDLDELLELHGAGYGPAIAADVQVVMASFSSINGRKMHGYSELLTDTLRDEMGFKGFVIGDWNGHAEIPGCTVTACVEALYAGLDMYMAPDSWKGLYEDLLAKAKSGELDLERLDEAVVRILAVKIRAGLIDSVKPSERSTSDPKSLGIEEHRAVARDAVRKSLVLLKNDSALLPLKPGQNVLVAGSGADSIEQQTGGWTLNWQGTGNSNEEFLTAQTIFGGIREAVEAEGGSATLSSDGSFAAKPDVAIVVFGEQPYAEYRGDRSDLVFETAEGENLALLRSLQEQGIPTISVFLSGRPLRVNPHLNASDAFVAAWLPGTEGGGIADVLIGSVDGEARYDFTGKLSFTWPMLGDGKPINGENAKGALFPFGYGLSYSGDTKLAGKLSEDPGIDLASAFNGSVMARGDATQGFESFLGDSSHARTPMSALVGESLSGAIRSRGIDYKAQEDAREVIWDGSAWGQYSVQANRPIDLGAFGKISSLELVLEWNITKEFSAPLELQLGCGEGCGGAINLSSIAAKSAGKGWQEVRIPLSCVTSQGMDLANTQMPFALRSEGTGTLSLHEIDIEASSGTQSSCAVFE